MIALVGQMIALAGQTGALVGQMIALARQTGALVWGYRKGVWLFQVLLKKRASLGSLCFEEDEDSKNLELQDHRVNFNVSNPRFTGFYYF